MASPFGSCSERAYVGSKIRSYVRSRRVVEPHVGSCRGHDRARGDLRVEPGEARDRVAFVRAGDEEYDLARSLETPDRKSTRLNSSHVKNSHAGFCLEKKIIEVMADQQINSCL